MCWVYHAPLRLVCSSGDDSTSSRLPSWRLLRLARVRGRCTEAKAQEVDFKSLPRRVEGSRCRAESSEPPKQLTSARGSCLWRALDLWIRSTQREPKMWVLPNICRLTARKERFASRGMRVDWSLEGALSTWPHEARASPLLPAKGSRNPRRGPTIGTRHIDCW